MPTILEIDSHSALAKFELVEKLIGVLPFVNLVGGVILQAIGENPIDFNRGPAERWHRTLNLFHTLMASA